LILAKQEYKHETQHDAIYRAAFNWKRIKSWTPRQHCSGKRSNRNGQLGSGLANRSYLHKTFKDRRKQVIEEMGIYCAIRL